MSDTTNYIINKNRVKVKSRPIHMWNHVKVIYLTTLALTYFVVAVGFGMIYYALTKPEPEFLIMGLYVICSSSVVFFLGIIGVFIRMIRVRRFYHRVR